MSAPMFSKQRLEGLADEFFVAVDSMDIFRIMDFFAGEATCQFANNLGIVGKANIEKFFLEFFTLLYSLKHHMQTLSIDLEQRVIYYGSMVSYIVKGDADKIPVDIPAMTVIKLAPAGGEGEIKIIDFRVYFDTSPIMEKVRVVGSKL